MRGCWHRVLVLRNSFLVIALTPQALLTSRATLGSIVRQIWSETSRPFWFTWNGFGNRSIRIFEIVRAGFDCANRSGFTQWKCRSYKNHGSRNGGGKVPSSSSVQCNAFCLECWQHPRSCFGRSVSSPSKHLLIPSLADPVRQYPGVFGDSKFFTQFPYALPNLCAASFLFISALFGFLFMKETLDSKKDQDDLGIRFRRFVHDIFKACFRLCSRKKKKSRARLRTNSMASEVSEFSSDEEESFPRGHRRRGSEEPMLLSPGTARRTRRPSAYYRYRRRSSSFSALVRPVVSDANLPRPPRFSDILTKQVILNMVVYAGLALHSISFDQLFPLLCSTKVDDGGLGMTPGQIGAALSVAGVMAMVLQITIFPWGHNKFGGLFCLRIVLGMYAGLYFVPSSL